jgi:hypothetical protein
MATTEYICAFGDRGRTFVEISGYLLGLVRSRPPVGDCYFRPWQERCLTLRDEMSPQAIFHLDITTAGRSPLVIGGAHYWINNAAIPFFGALTLVNIPFGSEFEITISDVHHGDGYVPTGMWSGNKVPRNPPLPRQLQIAAPPLQIASAIIEGIVIEREG